MCRLVTESHREEVYTIILKSEGVLFQILFLGGLSDME